MIIEKAREFQKTSTSASLNTLKSWTVWITKKMENSESDGNTRPPYLPPEKPVCRSRSNISNCMWDNRLVPNWEWSTSRVYIVSLLI